MVLKGSDGPFGGIGSMVMRWYELVLDSLRFEERQEGLRGLIVSDVNEGCSTTFQYGSMDGFVGGEYSRGMTRHKGLCKDVVGLSVVNDQYVVVPL